ncbi:MAG: hypothetical protein AB1512_18860 [Thermodesulfobacteriota bacterium]
MRRHLIRNGTEIGRIMEYLVDRGTDVEVVIEGSDDKYFSRLRAVRPLDEADGKALELEKLLPETGDGAIQQSQEVEITFWMDRYRCRFHSAHMHERTDPATSGHVIEFPLYVELEERRIADRITVPFPGFYSAVITLPQGDRKNQVVESSVLNYSNNGLGLLVKKWDFPLLRHVRPGDRIPGIILYGEGLLVNVSGFVRHKTEIMVGTHSGHFVLGIQSDMDLENHFHASRSLAS